MWAGFGRVEELKDVPADAVYTIVEGGGIKSAMELGAAAR
jgi:hypothetical protein